MVMLKVYAALDAFRAAAPDAPPRLPDCLLPGITPLRPGNPGGGRRPGHIGDQRRFAGALVPPAVHWIEILGQPVHRQGGFLRPKCRIQNPRRPGGSGNDVQLPAEHRRLLHGGPRQSFRKKFRRDAHNVVCRQHLIQQAGRHPRAESELNIHGLQRARVLSDRIAVEKFRAGSQKSLRVRLGAEYRKGIRLFGKLSRQEGREQAGTEDCRGLFLFKPQKPPALGTFTICRGRLFETAYGNGAAGLRQPALSLAWGLAAGGKDVNEGRDLLIKGKRL